MHMTTADGCAEQEVADGKRRNTGARTEVGQTDEEQEWEWGEIEGEDSHGCEPARQKGLEEMEDDVRREIELEREMEMEEMESATTLRAGE